MKTASEWFKEVEADFKKMIGHRLFTVMAIVEDGAEAQRIYTNDAAAYPLTGRKPLNRDDWYAHVIVGQHCFLATRPEEFRDAFSDHEKIVEMGLGSAINVPVVIGGHVRGTINLLDRTGAYQESMLQVCEQLAKGAAVNAFLAAESDLSR